jgi:hypothetical protein
MLKYTSRKDSPAGAIEFHGRVFDPERAEALIYDVGYPCLGTIERHYYRHYHSGPKYFFSKLFEEFYYIEGVLPEDLLAEALHDELPKVRIMWISEVQTRYVRGDNELVYARPTIRYAVDVPRFLELSLNRTGWRDGGPECDFPVQALQDSAMSLRMRDTISLIIRDDVTTAAMIRLLYC